jgi:hypothetical protein
VNQIYYKKIKAYKYQLALDYNFNIGVKNCVYESAFLSISESGLVTAKKGYAWDGASGPAFDTNSFMRGSLEHDIGYQLMRLTIIPVDKKEHIDQRLKERCLEDGMCKLRAWYVYRAVKKLGLHSCMPNSEKPEVIYCAPDDD